MTISFDSTNHIICDLHLEYDSLCINFILSLKMICLCTNWDTQRLDSVEIFRTTTRRMEQLIIQNQSQLTNPLL